MGTSKAEVKAKLQEILERIGTHENDYIMFDIRDFSQRWEADYVGKFKQYGYGTMLKFLRSELGAEGSDDKYRIKIIDNNRAHMEEGAAKPSSQHESLPDLGVKSTSAASQGNDLVRPKPKEGENLCNIELQELKKEVLTLIQELLQNQNLQRRNRRGCFTLNELSTAWAQKHHNMKFKQNGFGSLKSFLSTRLNFRPQTGRAGPDFFKISLNDVQREMQYLADGNAYESTEGPQHLYCIKNDSNETLCSNAPQTEDRVTPAVAPETFIDTVSTDKNANEVLQSSTGSVQCSSPPLLQCPASRCDRHSTATTQTEVRDEDSSEEEHNFMQLAKVLYKCGLKALRELFLRIHPSWNNDEDDIKTFKKGKFKPDCHEVSKFNSGNIYEWDITLICKVLLYSALSMQTLKNDASFRGYEGAIITIRSIKNSMLSHNKANKIAKQEYQKSIGDLKRSLIQIGFDGGIFEETLKGADLSKDMLSYQLFREELGRIREEQRKVNQESLGNQEIIIQKVDKLVEDVSMHLFHGIEQKSLNQSQIKQSLKSQPDFHEWLKVRRKLKHLDVENNQYILIADRFEEINSEGAKILADVPWKLVIDLDPDSDIDGFLTKFSPGKTRGGGIETFTPSKIRDANVDSQINPRRMLWLFANGRNRVLIHEGDDQEDNEDRQKNTIRDWKMNFKGPVQELIRTCCQKLDQMKPIFCIFFGIRSGISIQIAQELLEEIHCKFTLRKFSISYLSFSPELDLNDVSDATFTNLSQKLFLAGLTSLLGIAEEKYKLPSSQKQLPINLTQMQYNYLSGYLELLYLGCEEIPEELADDERKAFTQEHLKKFLCGNAISFPSLHYRHDASRCLTKKVCDRASELLLKSTKTQIVQITHAPGSGGTTIARRALWDLHEMHPCAIVKLKNTPENFGPDSEGEKYLSSLCECITYLEENCDRPPAILIDGNSKQVRVLSDCLVRKLEVRALVLRCAHYEKQADGEEDDMQSSQADKRMWKSVYFETEDERVPGRRNDTYFKKEDEFRVNPRLKDDDNDYCEFKMKYDHYCSLFPRNDNASLSRKRERVFHFPMMAMLDEFEKLGEIITESLNILKNEEPVEYEIAVMIAFLQLYSKFPTPASLIKKFVKSNSKTYKDVTKHFSETLMNLMIPGKAPSKEKFIGASVGEDYSDDNDDEGDDEYNSDGSSSSMGGSVLHSYSFQHLEVAKLVLDHSGRSLDQITQEFIQSKILENYRKDDEIRPLIDDMFLYNKESTGAHFSKLVIELAKGESGGRIFEDAAKQTQDVTFFSHVARFFAYKDGNFEKARDLIKEGFKTARNVPMEKKRGVFSTEGYIVLMEMKQLNAERRDIESIKRFSEEALDLFRKARDNPPWTFPNPLIGEVMVWQFCFEWFIERKNGNVEEAIKSILRDTFFSCAISECIYLLDEVDRIVDTVLLNDRDHTQAIANERRRLLMEAIGRGRSKTKRRGMQERNVDRLCGEIISKYNKKVSEKDLTRLQVLWLLSKAKKQIHRLDIGDRNNLFTWLHKLVIDFNMFIHTRDLMESAAELIKPPFSVDEALKIVGHWQNHLPNDPFSYLFQSMFCFLKVCRGSVYDYRPTYESAIEACRQKSQGNLRKYVQQYFLGKDGNGESILTITTRSKLESRYGQRETSGHGRTKEDILDQNFWDKHSRDFLLECTGRIECMQRSSRGKKIPYIMMEPGNIKINVPKSKCAIGTAHYDYQPDSRVSFVVCFTLSGPNARGIRFIDSMPKERKPQCKLSRQGSTVEKSKT